jgi:hypothetical protein
VVLPLLSILVGESHLLVSWCVGDICDMVGSDKDCGRSRKYSVEDQVWSSTSRVLGGRTIRRSGDVVCGLHCAQGDEERKFLGLASKPRATVCQWFDLKTGGFGFPCLGLETGSCGLVIWASKSLRLFFGLGLKTKWAMV